MTVTVREVHSEGDCLAVVDLTATNFPHEQQATKISLHKWREIQLDDWVRQPWLWSHVGVACEGEKIIGTVVLTIDDEEDGALSYWQISQRVGCLPTVFTMLYDNVLEEPLQPHEALIDFIAVSPEARGKGVGGMLLQWAEQRAAAILAERVPDSVSDHGVIMSLWVANGNSNAQRLYQRAGFKIVKSTNDAACSCFSSARMLRNFLGDPVWHKMEKSMPGPAPSPMAKPQPVAISITAVARDINAVKPELLNTSS